MKKIIYIIGIFLVGFAQEVLAQSPADGFSYQAILRDLDKNPILDAEVNITLKITSDGAQGTALYEERHNISTDSKGYVALTVGHGAVTGGSANQELSKIDWGASTHFLTVEIDKVGDGLGPYVFEDNQIMAVPYAYYAMESGGEFSIKDLKDVNTSNLQENQSLVWNGAVWQTSNVDSVNYAQNSNTANYADSVAVAKNVWKMNGNNDIDANTNFIGTTNSKDLVFKTNDQERMRITSDGKLGFGTNNPQTGFHVNSNNGFLFTGDPNGSIPNNAPGSQMMWYPGKSAFRAGYVTSNQWADEFIGKYTFSGGYNSIAKGDYSFSFGEGNVAEGEASTAFGWNSKALGDASFAAGSVATSEGFASVAIGRGTVATDTTSMSFGYHTKSKGKASIAMGYESEANADFSFATGWRARVNHKGTFMYVDSSNPFGWVESTGENQFVVRSSGGFEFYTDTMMTTGVILEPGAGSWSTLSDKNKKENFKKVDGKKILDEIRNLEVTTWNYKSQADSIRHMGPMAQDFYKSFKLGSDDKTITTTDIDGVNLAALKELEKLTRELEQKNEIIGTLESNVAALQAEKDDLNNRLLKLEGLFGKLLNQKEKERSEAAKR